MSQRETLQYPTRAATWCPLAILLVCAVIAHQFVMMAPQLHEHTMPVQATVMGTSEAVSGQCAQLCPTPVRRFCSAIEGILPATSPIPLTLVAILSIFVVRVLLGAMTGAVVDWRWPPDRHRVLLQVFRC